MKQPRLGLIASLLVGLATAGLAQTSASALPGLPIVGGYQTRAENGPSQTAQPGAPNIANSVWAGYTYTAPSELSSTWAGWTQPSVSCGPNETSFSSFWVGIQTEAGDGVPLIQTGTDADCSGGVPQYFGWLELVICADGSTQPCAPGEHFKYGPEVWGGTVLPGDRMAAAIYNEGGGYYSFNLSDNTRGWTAVRQHQCSCPQYESQLRTADVIAERPGFAQYPVAHFCGAAPNCDVVFDAVAANGAAFQAPQPWHVVNGSGQELIAVGNMYGQWSNTFNVGWRGYS